jgi:hypothetical protein
MDPRNPSPLASPVDFDEFDMLKYHLMNQYNHPIPGRYVSPQREAFAWHVRKILVNHGQYFGHLSKHLGTPEEVLKIPLTKTDQVPMRSMKIKQSSVDGNIEVMENLLQQGGLGDPTDPGFSANGDIDMSDYVLFIHGDLLTKERLDTVRDSRRIEDTPKNRFQFVVFLLGLFHYKMACADALWRTYLRAKEGRSDLNSTYQHVGIMRPRETGIMTSKPGFRRMHDVVHHELRAAILECWRAEASTLESANIMNLKDFTDSKPDWDMVVKMSEAIVEKYVATTEGLLTARARPEEERDQQFENQVIRNRDYLLYTDLCNAMNVRDIGRVEASFLPWIYIFTATGKHKYASQLARFVKNLHEVYPPALRCVRCLCKLRESGMLLQ